MNAITHTRHLASAVRRERKDEGSAPTGEAAVIAEKLAKAFEEFKETNDQQLAELKKGIADAVTADKLEKINKAIDDLQAAKDAAEKKHQEDIADLAEQMARNRLSGDGDPEAAAKELDRFNVEIKSFAGVHSRPTPVEMDAEGYESFRGGFKSYLSRGRDDLDGDARKALSVGSDPDGGFLVPADTSGRIVQRRYDLSPIRQIAAVQTISTDSLEGVRDRDEADSGWVAETQPRPATDAPQVGTWSIPVHEIYANPAATQKLLEDAAVNIEAWLSGKVGDKFARVEGAAFVVGNGVGKPRGFTNYPTAATEDEARADGVMEHVISGANGAFAASNPADKLFDLIGAFHPFYLMDARWVTRRTVITAIRKFKDGQGQYLWQPGLQAGQPQQLLSFPVTMAEDMPALATGSLSMAMGAFGEGYQIVDRVGIQTLRDPYTNKPYVHFYSRARVGGDVTNFDAIKFIKFSAS